MKQLQIEYLAGPVYTMPGITTPVLLHGFHHEKMPTRCCIIWFHISHGLARNQGTGESVMSHIVSLHSEYVHNLLLEQHPTLALLALGLGLGFCKDGHSKAFVLR